MYRSFLEEISNVTISGIDMYRKFIEKKFRARPPKAPVGPWGGGLKIFPMEGYFCAKLALTILLGINISGR